RVELLRGMLRGPNVAPIGQRRAAADLHVLLMLALVAAAEEAHAVREKHRVRRRCAARQRMPVEHALDLGLAADAAAVFRLLAEADQIGGAILPALVPVAGSAPPVFFPPRRAVVPRGL